MNALLNARARVRSLLRSGAGRRRGGGGARAEQLFDAVCLLEGRLYGALFGRGRARQDAFRHNITHWRKSNVERRHKCKVHCASFITKHNCCLLIVDDVSRPLHICSHFHFTRVVVTCSARSCSTKLRALSLFSCKLMPHSCAFARRRLGGNDQLTVKRLVHCGGR